MTNGAVVAEADPGRPETAFSLSGLRCVVTGGGSGIGSAIAELFCSRGARVIVNDLDPATARAVAQRVRAAGGQAHEFDADATDEAGVDAVIRFAEQTFGGVDILVNNASAGVAITDFADMTPADDSRSLSSFDSTVRCVRRALPGMIEQGFGRIVNVTSVSGSMGSPGLSMYSAAKAAIHGLSRSLAHEVAGHGITVNCVAPGMVDTARQHDRPPELQRRRLDGIPMGRMATPSEVAWAALYLASREAAYTTGEVLFVDGGRP